MMGVSGSRPSVAAATYFCAISMLSRFSRSVDREPTHTKTWLKVSSSMQSSSMRSSCAKLLTSSTTRFPVTSDTWNSRGGLATDASTDSVAYSPATHQRAPPSDCDSDNTRTIYSVAVKAKPSCRR